MLPPQVERQRMHTAAPRCVHTPGIYAIHMYTHICIYGIIYIYPGLQRMHPACMGKTGSLQHHRTAGIFPQVPGIEFHHFMHTHNEVSSCGSPGSIGGTETPAGQPIDAAHFPPCPAHTPSTAFPGLQEGCCK